VPRPRDWPERFEVLGYWWGPPEGETSVDRTLQAFLAGGEAPIYIGFGSMVGYDVERTEDIVLEALRGRRALLGSGWSGLGSRPLPSSAMRIGHLSHEWLFPQVRVVVHHGGAGTSHAAARAGAPSVVLPFGGDQRFWGERLRRVGIAPKPQRQDKLTAKELGDAIDAASTDAMRTRAGAVDAAMAQEHGVRTAVHAVERIVAGARGA
jgi:UDP:flavonoid glycosyltransferase YjiC (YdhE family)